MDSAKNKIIQIIKNYIQIFPDEYNAFKIGTRQKIELQKNKFGDMTKTSDIVIRPLFDIPETLNVIFIAKLTNDEKKWFESVEGARWFAKTFETFRIVEKI